MQQIAVRGVDLDAVEAQRDRRRLVRQERKRRRRDGAPSRRTVGGDRPAIIGDLSAALPGNLGGGLASGVRELNRERHVRIPPYARKDATHRRLGLVGPQADIGVGDPALGQNGGRLDGQKGGAGKGELAQMDQVPVGHAAVLGGILTHGRYDDAIGEFESGDAKRREEFGRAHGLSCSRRHGALRADG